MATRDDGAQPTPEPWLLIGDDFIYAPDEETGVNRFDCKVNAGRAGDARTSADEIRATALLMKSAPKLLEALRQIAEISPTEKPDDEDYDNMESAYSNGHDVAAWEAAQIARAAIADAEGRS